MALTRDMSECGSMNVAWCW